MQKDQYIAIANINAVNDLAKLSDRGIYDFGTMIQGFKAIEYIELPWFIQYMGFQTAPRNQQELRDKYRKLSLTSMNPEHYPEEFKKLQDAYELSKNWVG